MTHQQRNIFFEYGSSSNASNIIADPSSIIINLALANVDKDEAKAYALDLLAIYSKDIPHYESIIRRLETKQRNEHNNLPKGFQPKGWAEINKKHLNLLKSNSARLEELIKLLD